MSDVESQAKEPESSLRKVPAAPVTAATAASVSPVQQPDGETSKEETETCTTNVWDKFLKQKLLSELKYLVPHITATWAAVVFIFLIAGLSLKIEELKSAFKQVYFNGFVQIFNFGVVSAIGFGHSRALVKSGFLVTSLTDGMAICACLPMAINMVLILTKTAGGDEAAAIFNAAFANMVGVFLSPLLILGYLGVSGGVDLVSAFCKLILRVVLPLSVGQLFQKMSVKVVEFMKQHKRGIKKLQIYALVFVYTVFCKTFSTENDVGIGNVFLMLFFQVLLLCGVTVLA